MHLKKCCALRSIWRTFISSFYLHGDNTKTIVCSWEKQAPVWKSELTFHIIQSWKPCSGLVLPLLAVYGNVGKNENPYPATNSDIVLFCQFIPYPSSKFSSHSSSCVMLIDGNLTFYKLFHFCPSLVPLAILRGRCFTDERNGGLKKLKDMSKTTLVNASGGGKILSLLVPRPMLFPSEYHFGFLKEKDIVLALAPWLPYSRVDVRLILQ